MFSEGQAVYGCLTDNWPTVEPYFNETGSNCPSVLPVDQQKSLIDLAVQSTQALGFTQVLLYHTPQVRAYVRNDLGPTSEMIWILSETVGLLRFASTLAIRTANLESTVTCF